MTKRVVITVISKIVLLLGVSFFIAPKIPYLGNFPHGFMLTDTGLPQWLYSWGNFDGVNYMNIANRGYKEFEQAFFPLYPLLMATLAKLGLSTFWAGFVVSQIAAIGAAVMGYKICEKHLPKKVKHSFWHYFVVLFLFPTSFYFSALYTESLFLFVGLATVYFTLDRKIFWAVFFGILMGLVRIQGVFLVVILAALMVKKREDFVRHAAVIMSPLIGLLIYMGFLWYTTGDPIFFLTSQPAFGANRSTSLVLLPQVYWRYFKIFTTADVNFQYSVALLEFVFTSVALVLTGIHGYIAWTKKLIIEGSIVLYSLASIILPTLTGTFSSMPRYTLFVMSIYVVIVKYFPARLRVITLVMFAALQIVLASYFLQGYFVS